MRYEKLPFAGDLAIADLRFLSSRKADRAERCPQKTTPSTQGRTCRVAGVTARCSLSFVIFSFNLLHCPVHRALSRHTLWQVLVCASAFCATCSRSRSGCMTEVLAFIRCLFLCFYFCQVAWHSVLLQSSFLFLPQSLSSYCLQLYRPVWQSAYCH